MKIFFERDARHFVDEFSLIVGLVVGAVTTRILQDWEQNQLWL
jgi:uncharacterized membrane-anchored protein YhcB (DUF1043 family)